MGILGMFCPQVRVLEVWEKGAIILNYDPALWRRDAFGRTMSFSAYGSRNSDYGWEIDHILPVADGGTDDIDNLRPLHWRSNLARNS